MTPALFDALVARLESHSRRHPRIYNLKVLLLAALGYAYILFLLFLSVAILFAIIASAVINGSPQLWHFLLGIPALLLTFLIGRAIWAPLSNPVGVSLKRSDAPALFDTVENLRRSLRTPHIHQILLTDDFNASLVQTPRLGILGWQKNFLTLGLPMLLSLSSEQLTAVISHELGHLSRNHACFSGWIYRIEKTWSQALASFNKRKRLGGFLLRRFFNWYSPYFAAYSFVMRRANEFTADRASAHATFPALAAQALIVTQTQAKRLETYWQNLFTLSPHDHPSPPDDPFVALAELAGTPPDPAETQRTYRSALRRQTASTDSHPSLSERLAALGFAVAEDLSSSLPTGHSPLSAASAADQYFGPNLPALRARVCRLWRDHVLSGWVQRYNTVKPQLAELEKLNALAATRTLTRDEGWSQVHLTRDCYGPDRADPLAQLFRESHPDDAPNNFKLGQSLLDKHDDPAGVDLILAAMNTDSDAILGGCQILITYYTRVGEPQLALTYKNRHEERLKLLRQAQIERNLLRTSDRFEPHTWPIEKTQPLVDQLRQFKQVRRAYLLKKVVRHIPDIPCHILIVQPTRSRLQTNNQTNPHAKLRHRIATQIRFPESVLIHVLQPRHHLFRSLASLTPLYEKPPANPKY